MIPMTVGGGPVSRNRGLVDRRERPSHLTHGFVETGLIIDGRPEKAVNIAMLVF